MAYHVSHIICQRPSINVRATGTDKLIKFSTSRFKSKFRNAIVMVPSGAQFAGCPLDGSANDGVQVDGNLARGQEWRVFVSTNGTNLVIGFKFNPCWR